MTRRDPIAEDIAQETLLRAYLHWHELDPDRSAWPWLKKVATRLVYDQTRAQHRIADGLRVENAVEGREASFADQELVQQMLGRLPERQRAAVSLRYLDDWKSAEIAAVLDLPRSAVEQLLLRARRSLRTEYRRLSGDRLRAVLWPMLAWVTRLRHRAARGTTAVSEAVAPSLSMTAESMSALVVAGTLSIGIGIGAAQPLTPGTALRATAAGQVDAVDVSRVTGPSVRSTPHSVISSASTPIARNRMSNPARPHRGREQIRVVTGDGWDGPLSPRTSSKTGRDGQHVRSRTRVREEGLNIIGGSDTAIECDSGIVAGAACATHDAVVEGISGGH